MMEMFTVLLAVLLILVSLAHAKKSKKLSSVNRLYNVTNNSLRQMHKLVGEMNEEKREREKQIEELSGLLEESRLETRKRTLKNCTTLATLNTLKNRDEKNTELLIRTSNAITELAPKVTVREHRRELVLIREALVKHLLGRGRNKDQRALIEGRALRPLSTETIEKRLSFLDFQPHHVASQLSGSEVPLSLLSISTEYWGSTIRTYLGKDDVLLTAGSVKLNETIPYKLTDGNLDLTFGAFDFVSVGTNGKETRRVYFPVEGSVRLTKPDEEVEFDFHPTNYMGKVSKGRVSYSCDEDTGSVTINFEHFDTCKLEDKGVMEAAEIFVNAETFKCL